MSDNLIFDFCLERLSATDWLGLSSLYFDNSYTINIYATRGYVAYSPSKMCFFAMSCLDSTDSALVDNIYAAVEHDILGLQQNVTVVGYDHLQHIDIAQYSRYQFYNDNQTVMPWAKIPTRAEIMSLTKDETTGLYPGTDTVGLITDRQDQKTPSDRIISTIGFYPKTDGAEQKTEPKYWYYSGAIIENWQRFYKNQEKFKVMLNEAFGISDAI